MDKSKCYFYLILVLFSISSRSLAVAKQIEPSIHRSADGLLSESYAKWRQSVLGQVSYHLNLQLDAKRRNFSGEVTLQFTLKKSFTQDLTIDFGQGKVDQMSINGKQHAINYNGWFISIPFDQLLKGQNEIKIHFLHPYHNDGTGLHRFTDPEDGEVYLYTYLWPYYANQFFPCFDQPDIKAVFQLDVEVPEHWQVISSEKEQHIEHKDKRRLWHFGPTPSFSTYVFSLHAGPYKVWQAPTSAKKGQIPLRLFARRTLAKYIDAPLWFDYTRKGFAFYQNYFAIDYPFKKYDQLLVPEFNIGAMENIAAVTFTENLVPKGPSTANQRQRLANIILHEMAHMWFGNLVTMRWWNGLWLNESFATYMAFLASSQATEFKNAWHRFFIGRKNSAYQQDALITSHPIEVAVPDTGNFFSIFDSITYGKGASALTQLSHLLGPETFREGVRNYLQQNQYGNTELQNFIGQLAAASKQDLQPWVAKWLNQSGLNTVKAAYTCQKRAGQESLIEHFELLQSPANGSAVLRSHRVQIALYASNSSAPTLLTETFAGPSTRIDAAIGLPCPVLVFPNHNDWSFVKVKLDQTTINTLKQNLAKVQEPLARSMFWHSLWHMTLDAELPLPDYTELVLSTLVHENNEKVLRQVVGTIAGNHSALSYLERLSEKAKNSLKVLGPKIEDFIWQNFTRSKQGSDRQKLWLDAFIAAAHTHAGLRKLNGLLKDTSNLTKQPLDQRRRWKIIVKLNTYDFSKADTLAGLERKKDLSDAGENMAISAKVVRPFLRIKQRWLATITHPNSDIPLSKIKFALANLLPPHQTKLRKALTRKIFASLTKLSKTQSQEYLAAYARTLLFGFCLEPRVDKLAAATLAEPEMSPVIIMFLRQALEEKQRCQQMAQLMDGKSLN